jgi:MoaA/NifB/PqqE/SkfB family radical SAM enzyme
MDQVQESFKEEINGIIYCGSKDIEEGYLLKDIEFSGYLFQNQLRFYPNIKHSNLNSFKMNGRFSELFGKVYPFIKKKHNRLYKDYISEFLTTITEKGFRIFHPLSIPDALFYFPLKSLIKTKLPFFVFVDDSDIKFIKQNKIDANILTKNIDFFIIISKKIDNIKEILGIDDNRLIVLQKENISHKNVDGLYERLLKEYAIDNFIKNGPYGVSIKLTNKCNAFCKMCRIVRSKTDISLDINVVLETIRNIKDIGVKRVTLTGGEPLLIKEVFDILKEIKKLGLRPILDTNGILLTKECASKLKECGVKNVEISIDSPVAELHDSIRNVPGIWDKAVQGIKYCKQEGIFVSVNMCIMRENYRLAPALFEMAVNNDVDRVGFFLQEYFTVAEDHTLDITQLKEFYFDIIPTILKLNKKKVVLEIKPFFSSLVGLSDESIIQSIKLRGNGLSEELLDYSTGKYGKGYVGERMCLDVWDDIKIRENGDVYMCCRGLGIDYFRFGNIYTTSIKDIWNSVEYKKARENPKHEICNLCKECTKTFDLFWREYISTNHR